MSLDVILMKKSFNTDDKNKDKLGAFLFVKREGRCSPFLFSFWLQVTFAAKRLCMEFVCTNRMIA